MERPVNHFNPTVTKSSIIAAYNVQYNYRPLAVPWRSLLDTK